MKTNQISELTKEEVINTNGGSLSYTFGQLIHDLVNNFTAWI